MQIYLPPDRRFEATPATPATATPVATTAVVAAAVATAPTEESMGLGVIMKAQPGAGRLMRSRVEAKYWSMRV